MSGPRGLSAGLLEHGLEVRLRGLQSIMVARIALNGCHGRLVGQCLCPTAPEHWRASRRGTQERLPVTPAAWLAVPSAARHALSIPPRPTPGIRTRVPAAGNRPATPAGSTPP